MNIWLTIFGMAAVTYAIRVLPFLTARTTASPALERVLRYVPPAIFTALIIPGLLTPNGPQLEAGATLLAGLVGAVVAWYSRNVALTIIAGLAAFAFLRYLGLS